MKKTVFKFTTFCAIICTVVFTSCNKEKVNPKLTQEEHKSSKDLGITVKEGRLRFASVEKLNELIAMNNEQKQTALKDFQNLPGFTFKKRSCQ